MTICHVYDILPNNHYQRCSVTDFGLHRPLASHRSSFHLFITEKASHFYMESGANFSRLWFHVAVCFPILLIGIHV